MKIYNYNVSTGEFINEGLARDNPKEEGNFLIPANSTRIAPPDLSKGFIQVFDSKADSWSLVEDHRGQVMYNAQGKEITISDLGSIPKGLVSKKPYIPPKDVDIKAEASQRIISILPEWKQRNMAAEASILSMKVAKGGVLNAQEQKKWAKGQAVWEQISKIRKKSNELEALLTANKLQKDWQHDKYWK